MVVEISQNLLKHSTGYGDNMYVHGKKNLELESAKSAYRT